MIPLHAQTLEADPRVKQAKSLLLEAIEERQSDFTGVRPPTAERTSSYQELLNRLEESRGMPLYYPYLGSGIGRGSLVELMDGSIKYDFISGIGVHYFGHSHPQLISSAIDAAISDVVMQGNLQHNVDVLSLMELLVESSGLDHCILSTSGAMANENALKLMLQKRSPASRILAFEHCFMGRTWMLSQITDKPQYRDGLPLNIAVDYIPFYDALDPSGSTKRAANALTQHLKRYPGQHALMCFELIQGEAGFWPGSTAFFKTLMSICREHSILIFADEVQSFGRTEALFAYQLFGLSEYIDATSVGKLSQVCATMYRSSLKPKPGLISQTFTASSAAVHAGYEIIHALLHEDYLGKHGKIHRIHEHFVTHLQRLEEKYPDRIAGPFGIGTMIAFTPFGGDYKKVCRFLQKLFDAGVIGFIAGQNPSRVRFLIPAGGITSEDIDKAMKIVEETLLSDGLNDEQSKNNPKAR